MTFQCSFKLAAVEQVSLNDSHAIAECLESSRSPDKCRYFVAALNRLLEDLKTYAPGGTENEKFHTLCSGRQAARSVTACVHSPETCLVATFTRLNILIRPIWTSSAASAGSS